MPAAAAAGAACTVTAPVAATKMAAARLTAINVRLQLDFIAHPIGLRSYGVLPTPKTPEGGVRLPRLGPDFSC